MSVLVVGGSQGARILSDVVPAGIALLPEALRRNIRVFQQARAEDVDRVNAFYAARGINADIRTFFDDMPTRLAEAQLVIARSGASTIADLTVIGRPAVLIPYAAAAQDHQSANARGLVEAGAAIMVPEAKANPETLTEQILAVLEMPDGALQMSRAALSVGKPDAAETLADMVEQLGSTGKISALEEDTPT